MPRSARRMVWLARAISAVALFIGLITGARAASEGAIVFAFLYLAISVAFVLATWVSPLSPLVWVAIAGMVTVMLVLEPNVVTATLAIAAALLFWLRGRKQSSPVNPASLRAVPSDTVMRGAEAYVGELEDLGWRQSGAYAFDTPLPVVASLLVHPDMDQYAEVTDSIFGILSRFSDNRVMVTINSGRAGLPPNYLANDLLGASPTELTEAHQRVLEMLTAFGATPLPVDEATLVEEAISSEIETIEWTKQNPSGGLFNFGRGVGSIDASGDARARIEAWLGFKSVEQ